MKILVIGGAGYIGSVVVESLVKNNEIVVYDDLSTGFKKLVNKNAKFIRGSILNLKKLNLIMKKFSPEIVINLAAKIVVPESVDKPLEYYQTNVTGMINILTAMNNNGVRRIIFSSSAATYGNAKKMPISEETIQNPCNPYGQSKLIAEKIIFDVQKRFGISYVIFRFFNVAGASKTLNCGMMKKTPTLLIPCINKAVLSGNNPVVFGDDYNTRDGSCLRDYVHVEDLASAHLKAIPFLLKNKSGCFNLGSNTGYTVLEVIKETEKVIKKKIEFSICPRRAGDPDALLTSNKLALKELKWKPIYSLKNMIESDLKFRKKINL